MSSFREGPPSSTGVSSNGVVETHVHDDYVTGGLEPTRPQVPVISSPPGAQVSYVGTADADGDTFDVDADLTLLPSPPGHKPHHIAYVLSDGGRPVAAFTGGSLLIGTVGCPDLVEPRLTEQPARAQHASAHRACRIPAR